MARKYNRDSNGRFASGGGSTGGRGGSSSRPAAVGNRGPRGGKVGTRTEQRRAAKAQQQRSQAFRSKATTGREARAAWKSAAGAARAARGGASNGIRPTGGLPRPVASNGIRRTTGPRRAPLAARSNAIRAYRPVTPRGQMDHGIRMMDKSIKVIKGQLPAVHGLKKRTGDIMNRMARSTARTIVESQQKGVLGDIARTIMRGEDGVMQRAGREVIRRRARRAAAAAARGSKPAAKAIGIYDRQLAPVLSGKPGKKASNTIKPGPRNANPPQKKPRKPRTPKPPGTPKPKRKPRKPKS